MRDIGFFAHHIGNLAGANVVLKKYGPENFTGDRIKLAPPKDSNVVSARNHIEVASFIGKLLLIVYIINNILLGSTALRMLEHGDEIVVAAFPKAKSATNITNRNTFFEKYYNFFQDRCDYYDALLKSNKYKRDWETRLDTINITEYPKLHCHLQSQLLKYQTIVKQLEEKSRENYNKEDLFEDTFLYCFKETWKGI